MIRPVATLEGKQAFAFSARGLAVLGLLGGLIIASSTLGLISLHKSNVALSKIEGATASRILFSCYESNGRHREAKEGVEALARVQKPPAGQTPAQRQLLIDGLTNAFVPAYVAGDPKLPLAERERLGCEHRLHKIQRR